MYRDTKIIVERIESWLKEQIVTAGAKGGVVGISGGVDSAVVAVLLKRVFGDNMLSVIMPCESLHSDVEHAELLARTFNLPCITVDLEPAFKGLLSALPSNMNIIPVARANIKPRLRMTTLYLFGQQHGYLVCGTGNKVEITVGYFTKYGDGGADLLPLGDLLKGEVRNVAKFLGVPEEIVNKTPSAGLWEGQTDEGEMGVTYDALDRYLALGEGDERVAKFVEEARRRTGHKRLPPPICQIG